MGVARHPIFRPYSNKKPLEEEKEYIGSLFTAAGSGFCEKPIIPGTKKDLFVCLSAEALM